MSNFLLGLVAAYSKKKHEDSRRNERNAREQNSPMLHEIYFESALSTTSTDNVFLSFVARMESCTVHSNVGNCWARIRSCG